MTFTSGLALWKPSCHWPVTRYDAVPWRMDVDSYRRALDARNYFAPGDEPAPKYQRNQFGFSLGGPIKRDRAFFFVDYEATRGREGITRTANVPTEAERAGETLGQEGLGRAGRPFEQDVA